MTANFTLSQLENASEFHARHIGIDAADEALMLKAIGETSRRALIDSIVPRSIARSSKMDIPAAITEAAALAEIKVLAGKNKVLKSFIGQGYYGTHTPGVILRNILENPAWYTAYTPYQAEISQGRMEALINFQTMVCDLTGMPMANASMLDEATAAAEAMTLAKRNVKSKSHVFVVAGDCHPQIIEVIQTRAKPLGITVQLANSGPEWEAALAGDYFAVLVQYPATSGRIPNDLSALRADVALVHSKQAAFIVAADLLALTLLTPPGEFDADIVVGTTQRFGMPLCNGGPHAAYMACRDEYKRSMPGRIVGVSIDTHGNPAYRLALQTREQHIRREKATSNICTAQVLPAVVASMYAVYHGPDGLSRIAQRVAKFTAILAKGLEQLGAPVRAQATFDTVSLKTDGTTDSIANRAVTLGVNLRTYFQNYLCISLDETTTREDITLLWSLFAQPGMPLPSVEALEGATADSLIPAELRRTSSFMTHPVFNTHHSETGMLRYIRMLSDKDLALDRSMIPLGSCTMKLNATSEMIPITWPEFANIHPFCPADQRQGYAELDEQLRAWLCAATGYSGISLQPNAGSQGEYAGLLVIQAYHASKGEGHRNICLIPSSAHGTNPASAQMVGMQVVVTKCDDNGNVDMTDLKAKCEQYSANLAAVMITYPSTHGVFETSVKELCALVHHHGGRVFPVSRGQQHRELLAADPRHHVDESERHGEQRGQVSQHRIAGRVAVGVVDALEVVDVEQDHRQRPWRALPAFDLEFGGPEEGAPVGDAGQVVAGVGAVVLVARDALLRDVADHEAVGRGRLAGARGNLVAVAHRGDHRAAPELRAVGAPTPAVVEAPAVVVGLVQPVAHPIGRGRAFRVEDGERLAEHGLALETGDAADARVPVVDAAAGIEADERVVGHADEQRIEPGFALLQLPFALDLQRDIAEHGHQTLLVELEQVQRQHLRVRLAALAGADLDAQRFTHRAVRVRKAGDERAQVGCDVLERIEEVGEIAVGRERQQQLGRERVDHHDLAAHRGLRQTNRRQVHELGEGLVLPDGIEHGNVKHVVVLRKACAPARNAERCRARRAGAGAP